MPELTHSPNQWYGLLRGAAAILLGAGFVLSAAAEAGQLTLTDKGRANCVIIVPPGTMNWDGEARQIDRWGRMAGASSQEVDAERRRRLQRDSVLDLAHYLGRMAGTKIEIHAADAKPAPDRQVPIFIGAAAQAEFGAVGITKAGKFGFRVVAEKGGSGQERIGLYGESEYGTSYAIYELLHRLGCRWFMPSELGEVIPELLALSVPEMDEKLAPATEWRRMEGRTADEDFVRRNRFGRTVYGGNVINAQHTLEGYITAGQREQNPEWRLHIDGQPKGNLLRWTREDVANAIADSIISRLDENYVPSVSLSPGDYVVPTEDPEERKHDPEPRVWEPAAGRWSVTDRLMLLANRVAARVGKKYPDVLFGLPAYVNYNLPPAREPVHPRVIPVLAPIDFNRHHPMTWPDHPNKFWLKDMLEGWAAKADRLAYYAYGMNLAEISAPNPFITKWGTDIPLIMKNKCVYWATETMGGWESMLPGFYLSMRLTFYPDEKAEDILADLWTRFYGAAAEPMAAYWRHMDRAWIEAREYSGAGFGYLRMFTPEVMKQARKHIDEALDRCRTIPEYRRVKMIDESLTLFALFMKMREDFAAGRLRNLAADLDAWRSSIKHLRDSYRPQFGFDSGLALSYVEWFCKASYEDASRLDREHARLGQPMLKWKWRHNPGSEEEALPWAAPDFDDKGWPETQVVRETWSTLGHHNTMSDAASGRSGRMAYRARQRLNALPEGKRAWLWIGATDGSAKVYVNGRHIPYTVPTDTRQHKAGTVLDRFSGYCAPARFDITEALQAGDNQFTVFAERTNLNELGTGGLMGPVVIFREK